VASNSNVNFNGASTTVDKVVLYNNTAAGNQCNANGNSGACANVTTLGPKLDLASAASMAFIDEPDREVRVDRPLRACCRTGWPARTAAR
jgi:hypothetical protein